MKLRPYQDEAADFLYETDRAMILAAVGAGKTAITLAAMQDMVRQGVARRWLVLAPKRVATDVWPVEAPKWAPGLTLAVAVGTPAQRAAAFASKADVVVTNYDTIQTLPSLDGFDGVVFDELTRLKNPSGARFKDLFKKLDNMKFRWGLTGSFTSNGLEDVFGQCKVINVDLLGRSKGAFLQTWFIPISREFGQWVARPSALAGIMAKIKPATFVLDAGEYSDKLPPLNVVEVKSTMDMKAYDRMKRDYVAQVGGETVTALTAAAVTQKLQQLACIANGVPVLTRAGWVPIQKLADQEVWDGEAWVRHGGVVARGSKEVGLCHGVPMTYDHKVLTVSGWRMAEEIWYGASRGRFNRAPVRLPNGYRAGGRVEVQVRALAMPMPVWERGSSREPVCSHLPPASAQLRVPARQPDARHDRHPPVPDVAGYGETLPPSIRQRFRKLRRTWHRGLSDVGGQLRCFLAGYAGGLRGSPDDRPDRQQRPVHPDQLSVGDDGRAAQQPTGQRVRGYAVGPHDGDAGRAGGRSETSDFGRADTARVACRAGAFCAETYDILSCGPRNRFVVLGRDGPLIVHNCGWAYSPSPVWFSSHRFDRLEELLAENQRANTLVVYNYREELAELKRRYPQAQTLDDPYAIQRWNDGDIEMLLVHPKCLHPETEVLTEYRGWVPIVDVLASERVFDGVEYVSHSGCVYSGHETVVERFGIRMTPAHRLLVGGAWVEAKDVGTDSDTERKARYVYEGNDARLRALLAVRHNAHDAGAELAAACPQRGSELPCLPTRPDASASAESVGCYAPPLQQRSRQGICKLRRPGHISVRALASVFRRFLLRHGPHLLGRHDVGSPRRERGLRAKQLPVGIEAGAASQQAHNAQNYLQGPGPSSSGTVPIYRFKPVHSVDATERRDDSGRGGSGSASVDIQEKPQTSDVYDLVDCGPRSRFVIRNAAGEAFISHNSAGHGLNLQHGGSHIVFVSLPWSLELFEQTVGRLHRSGQKHPVWAYVLMTEKTIDERIWQSLHDKRSLSQLATEELAA